MHFFFYVRGINHMVEVWKTLAQGVFWKWKRKNIKTDKEEYILVQGSLRPSALGAWEYVFPEECLAEVLKIMGVTDGEIGARRTFMNKAKLATLRKMFGAQKISKETFKEAKKVFESITLKDSWRGLSHLMVKGVSIHPIGIKKDVRREVMKGWIQEEL